jgi:hypothetical protein
MGDVYTRKTLHKITVFIRPEERIVISMAIRFDWGDHDVLTPDNYTLEALTVDDFYGEAVYGTSLFSSTPAPVLIKNVEGSNFSNSLTFTSSNMEGSFSIQAILYEYSVNGRK